MVFPEKRITLSNEKACIFRTPAPEDATEIVKFLRLVAVETPYLTSYPEEITITSEDEEKKINEVRTDPLSSMIAVFCDSRLIGLATLDPVSKRSKLSHRSTTGIAILSEYWGMGIGNILINELTFLAAQVGYEQVELSVHRSNSRAIHLYQRQNFEVYGRLEKAIKFKDGTYCDEYLMVKRLNSAGD